MDWDKRFLDLAEHISQWSKDPSTKVGAVIVRHDRTIASLGFNGFPRGVGDTSARLLHRPAKLALTVHAELNAILSAREPLHGHTLYCVPFHPCSNCAAAIVQSGIKRVVFDGETPQRWAENVAIAQEIFVEAGVETNG